MDRLSDEQVAAMVRVGELVANRNAPTYSLAREAQERRAMRCDGCKHWEALHGTVTAELPIGLCDVHQVTFGAVDGCRLNFTPKGEA